MIALAVAFIAPGAMAIDLGVNNNDPACNSGPGAPFCTISGALGLALPGDTITVARGTYADNIEVNTSNLSIVGIGAPTLRTSGSISRAIVTINATGVRFEGFEVTGWTNGIIILGNNNIVSNNRVHDNGFTEIGLGLFGGEGVRVADNLVADNSIAGGSSGIAVNGDRNTIIRNQVTNITISAGVHVSGNKNVLRKNLVNAASSTASIYSVTTMLL